MALPRRAKLLITYVALGGGAVLAAAGNIAIRGGDVGPAVRILFFAALIAASWIWPLILYRGPNSSEAHHFDEGLLVLCVLLLPPAGTLLAFALATVVAQAVRHRPLIKSVFNLGQIMLSVGLAVAVVQAIAPPAYPLSVASVGAAGLGALVFFVANTGFCAAIAVTAGGVPWREAALDGIEILLLLLGACTALGLMEAMTASAYSWSLVAVPIPFLVLRAVLAGHFEARHDRARLMGLLDATLAAHSSINAHEVERALTGSARNLLRSPVASISAVPPADDELGASVAVDGDPRWLIVSGRSKAEPFDSADQSLLDALVTVAGGSLTNAALYQEGRFQRERLSAITRSLAEGVCALDLSGRVTFLNPAAREMLGWPDARPGEGVLAPEPMLVPALHAMEALETCRNDDTTFRRADESILPVSFSASPIIDDGVAVGAVVAFRDITERKAFEEELARHAFHDALTGLANRRLFIDHLDHAILRSVRNNETHAVLFLDVDRFKVINDGLGHHAGDELLIAIANRLRATLRPDAMLARFGGDEFTVLLEGVHGASDVLPVVERLLDALRQPVVIGDGHEVVATLSAGISFTAEGKSRDDLLRDADVAMYKAKARGRAGFYEIFDATAMGARSAERVDLEAALRRAIERDELEVFYQPLVGIEDRQVIGAEALVRWNHPQRGLLQPDEFIGLAEESGLILPLGRFVLEEACRCARRWKDRYGLPLSMSVNLSARQFQQPGLIEDVAEVLRSTGVDPRQICLEITETLAIEDVERSTAALVRLKELGVRLAIDDFGTGFSSLSYLKRFPVDVVKIDKSFVDGVDTNPVASAIAAAVIGLAKAIGITTVAEGVETLPQLEHLRALGCPVIQGYYVGRPMPDRVIGRVLNEQLCRPRRVRHVHLEPAVADDALFAHASSW